MSEFLENISNKKVMIIDTDALEEMLRDFGIDANIISSSNGYCEVETNDYTYLLTKELTR